MPGRDSPQLSIRRSSTPHTSKTEHDRVPPPQEGQARHRCLNPLIEAERGGSGGWSQVVPSGDCAGGCGSTIWSGAELCEPSNVTGVSPARQKICRHGVDIGGRPSFYGWSSRLARLPL
jgi:hypothetical protein